MGPMLGDNENENTDEVVGLRVERRTCELDVGYRGSKHGTLDSGAGVPLQPRNPRLRMSAANGSTLENLRRHVSLRRAVEDPRGVKIGAEVPWRFFVEQLAKAILNNVELDSGSP